MNAAPAPALFTPIRLRELTLPNRVVVAPMCQYSAIDGCAQPWHTVHLGQLAIGDAGLLIIEATAVDAVGRITPGCLGLYDDANEAAFAALMKTLRGLDPARHLPIAIQLGHAGRKASSFEPWRTGRQIPIADGGWTAVAPSAIAHGDGEEAPRAMSVAELDALVGRFVDATRRAERIGIDAIELHAAHGYLLHQFLSPLSNRRDDAYGGSLENRMRFPLEVLAAMRAAWPASRPLGVRISASDWDARSSWTIDEARVFAGRCEALGADWIDASSGGVSREQKIAIGPGYQVPFAREIRRAVDIPVMAVGLITEATQAEAILQAGDADMIALARAFLYDPRWVWHAARELGATVKVPPQYWRSEPAGARGLYGDTRVGMR
ncbi:MAG: NADH:flavin oxidoreductase/NADH oxidase [Lautropia sp.]